jgi:mycothiol synthase
MNDLITIPNAPNIEGLIFRKWRGPEDLPGMRDALNASEVADGLERVVTVEELANSYRHLRNSNLDTDFAIAEINGEIVGYVRVEWFQNAAKERIYTHVAFFKPEWRRKGLGTALLAWAENRLREIASEHPNDGAKYFDRFVNDKSVGLEVMLQKADYKPARYGVNMVRPTLDDIPDNPLPAGLEVRPVTPNHYRLIWDAADEAFQDHWGYSPSSEEEYQMWLNDKTIFTPELWKIAWDVEKNEIAGQVRGFINHVENETFNRKRGYCEFISTRRPWRKRGLASALISLTLKEFKDRGMAESALGADAENLSGAVKIYRDAGFCETSRATLYRKSL